LCKQESVVVSKKVEEEVGRIQGQGVEGDDGDVEREGYVEYGKKIYMEFLIYMDCKRGSVY
jgi:hypothetical protein